MQPKYDPAILWPCLSIGLCALHPLFLFAAFFLTYKYREPWIAQINQQFSTHKWWYFAFPVFAFIVGYINAMPYVRDDLMMHVIAYKFSYDFRLIYVHAAPLPTFNFWIGFEMFAGFFHRLLGPEYSIKAIQAITVVTFYTSFFFAIYTLLKEREDKWLWCMLIFAISVSPFSYRIFLGRPDLFFSAWLLAAVFLRPVIWLIIGILIMPAYSLSILYAPAALLLNTSWRNKIIYGALYSISCVVFWYLYSDGNWLGIPQLLSVWISNRTIDISELLGTKYILGNVYMVGLLIMLFYFFYKASFKLTKQAASILLVMAFFLLPNYIRYTTVLISLICLLCAMYAPKIKVSPPLSLFILVVASLIASKVAPGNSYESIPKFKLPPTAVVLTQFDEGVYSGILHNPEAKFSPAMEIGANEKAVQKLISDLHEGNPLNCTELKKFSFTYVQENRLKSIPPCLTLSAVDGVWRLWEIK
jgi:hypothetical protein